MVEVLSIYRHDIVIHSDICYTSDALVITHKDDSLGVSFHKAHVTLPARNYHCHVISTVLAAMEVTCR